MHLQHGSGSAMLHSERSGGYRDQLDSDLPSRRRDMAPSAR
jgi:hypothetical protein